MNKYRFFKYQYIGCWVEEHNVIKRYLPAHNVLSGFFINWRAINNYTPNSVQYWYMYYLLFNWWNQINFIHTINTKHLLHLFLLWYPKTQSEIGLNLTTCIDPAIRHWGCYSKSLWCNGAFLLISCVLINRDEC